MKDCPLCQHNNPKAFYQRVFREKGREYPREYFYCPVCHLVFLDPQLRLTAEEEKQRYDTHENDISQPGYRDFLNQLWQPLKGKLQEGMKGLDYGCGPTHALATLAKEDGFLLETFDPIFEPKELKENSFDFITCTEVVEHFRQPKEEFEKLHALLKPGGTLAIMTDILQDPSTFSDWYYIRDLTHICFYQASTFQWLAEKFSWNLQLHSSRVVFLQKG